jgi:hypothetical protein
MNSFEINRKIRFGDMSNILNEFLHRIESQRLEDECLRPIDLRPHVTGPCKRFSYRGHSLWLNAQAHSLFLDGLDKNSGVFTVATYESILKRCVGEAFTTANKENRPVHDEKQSISHALRIPSIETVFESEQIANNVIDLSYFEQRVYERYRKFLHVKLILKGRNYIAETRDISQAGLKLRLKNPIDVSEDDVVRVDVTPSAECQLKQPQLDYRVVRINRLMNDTFLSLQCIESEAKDGMRMISKHVAKASQDILSEPIDPQDALLTAQAMLAERFYMRSTSVLPFFVFACKAHETPLRVILGNQVNRLSLDAFVNSQGGYDFSTLVTKKRIKLLTRLALRNSKAETMIAVYRSPEHREPQIRADLECKNHKHWRRLLMRYVDLPGFRLFKVVARAARRPVAIRVEDALKPINKDKMFVNKLTMDAKALSIVGALIDMTEQIRNWRMDDYSFNDKSNDESIVCYDDDQYLSPPILLPIHYIQEKRSEDRFLGQMEVEVSIAGRFYTGMTRDISPHGLSVEIAGKGITFINDRQATITFTRLDAQSSSKSSLQDTFHNVPAELVTDPCNGDQLLHFKICDVTKGHRFSQAFSSFLEKRQANLYLDSSHIMRAAASRLYSSIFIESSSSLPVFIYRRSYDDWSMKLGISAFPAPLLDFFEVADGVFDFNVLANKGRLKRIMKDVTKSGSSELILYLCKVRHGETPAFDIQSLADFEVGSETDRSEFMHHAMDNDFRCIKVILNQTSVPPITEVEQAIDQLAQQSPCRSKRLKADFNKLIAVGDIVDITGLAMDLWSEQ